MLGMEGKRGMDAWVLCKQVTMTIARLSGLVSRPHFCCKRQLHDMAKKR
jgi:hypothetical protein